jgi:hypothetical protein
MPAHLQTDQGSETAYDNKQVGTLNSKQNTPLILGVELLTADWQNAQAFCRI